MSDTPRRILGKFLAMTFAFVVCSYFALSAAAAQTTQPQSAQASAPMGCDPSPAPVLADFSNPPNLDTFKRQLVYYRCAQYDADIAAVLGDAKQWVALRAPQVANPAIILDIDETSLSNWAEIKADDFGYIGGGSCDLSKKDQPCGDEAWEASEEAPAIAPTRDLYRLARCIDADASCKKIDVFFITGRRDSQEKTKGKTPAEWTLENLIKAGYEGMTADHLHMRPTNSDGPVAPYKSGARAEIEDAFKVTIIANVGDQISDLAGGHAERTFKVPNPFYFIP
jgi:predicted secreted acid phosphatase